MLPNWMSSMELFILATPCFFSWLVYALRFAVGCKWCGQKLDGLVLRLDCVLQRMNYTDTANRCSGGFGPEVPAIRFSFRN